MLTEERFEEAYKHLDEKIELIRADVHYLRGRLDSSIWKIIGIGASSGALGFAVSLLISRWGG